MCQQNLQILFTTNFFQKLFTMKKQLALTALLGFFTLNLAFAQGKLETAIRNFYVAVDAGDFSKVESFFAPEAKASLPVSPVPVDVATFMQIGMGFKTAFPDYRHKVIEGVEGKNVYAFKGWFSGTNTGSMMGNPPTGNRVEMPYSGYGKFNDAGKIVEWNILFDMAGFNAQLMKGLSAPQEANKQAVLKIMGDLDKRKLDAVTAAYSPNTRFNGWAPMQLDVNGYTQVMSGLLASFPDSRFVIEDVVTEGDKVVVRHRFEGTHTGTAFQGVPTSNKRAVAPATATFQLKDGKPVELWLNADFLGLMIQIGGIPAGK